MRYWLGLTMALAAAGCINGAPLPPTPASSLAVLPASDRAAQDAEYIELARNFLRAEGKDPAQATYEVHRSLPRDGEQAHDAGDGPPTAAIVKVDFLNGAVWELDIKTDGDIVRRADR
jgi:hypothetical protein